MPSRSRSPLLTISEAARIANHPESTVRWWLQLGRLPSVKPGRRRMVPMRDLAEFLGVPLADLERARRGQGE